MTRRICVVSGSRADFGLLRPLLSELQAAEDVHLQLVVTGSHLSALHGTTVQEILACGFKVDEAVDMLLAADSPRAVGLSLGLGLMGLTGALSRLAPDVLVLLGDRYEALAAAQAALVLGIPIAHIHGGEATEGAIDEAIRHAITKMSHLHFVAADPFRRRVIQMGEQPATVHMAGALGLDNIAALIPTPRAELEQLLGIVLDRPILLVTYHPVTLSSGGLGAFTELLAALDMLRDVRVVFTGANADASGLEIAAMVKSYCATRPGHTAQVASLGFQRYLSLMALSAAVVGNSSSGLLEAPSMGIPSVNIGPRQRGRPRAPSVIDCGGDAADIAAALAKALGPDMRQLACQRQTPYGTAGAARRIAAVLRQVSLEGILMKRFHDQ
jgi:UDP-hydrolysing UDP-N-acetyl-D-glucosamine 2-epimerase